MKAILTKVPDETYVELCRRVKQYGFESVYEFMKGLVGMALLQMSRLDYRKEHPNEPYVMDEIDEMFSPLENWESPRYGERTKRTHDPQDRFGEQSDEGTFYYKNGDDEGEELQADD